MNSSSRRRRRRRILTLVLLFLVAGGTAAYFLRFRDDQKSAPAAPATEVVKRGDVRSTVAGVGTLQPETSVSLGFGEGGRVSEVDVKLGQQVKAGQVLARLDDSLARTALGAAQAQVTAAEAKVTQLSEGHTPQELIKVSTEGRSAKANAAAAEKTAAKARASVASEVKTARTAATQARKTHQVAVERLADGRSKLSAKEQRAAADKTIYTEAKTQVEGARAEVLAMAGTKEANRKKAEEEEAKERKKLEEESKKERELAEAEGVEYKGKETAVIQRNPETSGIYAEAQAQSTLESAQAHLTETQSAYEKSRSELETLRTSLPGLRDTVRSTAEAAANAAAALRSGRATAEQTARAAEEAAATAQSTLQNTLAAGAVEAQPAKAGEMAEAISAVTQAEANVATSEKRLGETVLRAPAAGRVANLKLAVGDVVSGGQTSQAKAGTGTESTESGSTEGASSEGSSSGSTSASSSAPSITLASPHLKLFAVSLTQADVIKVKPGDSATLIIDALNRTVKGKVVSVAPLPVVKNGVVNYTVTVGTSSLPEDLKIGMTAEVTLLTAESHNVPTLSRAAVPATTGSVSLEVLKGGKAESRTVQLGLSGDESVEVKKGLAPGDKVILPALPEAGGEEEFGEEEEFGGEEGGFE